MHAPADRKTSAYQGMDFLSCCRESTRKHATTRHSNDRRMRIIRTDDLYCQGDDTYTIGGGVILKHIVLNNLGQITVKNHYRSFYSQSVF